ncbi:FecR family protein [Wenyingzhuangia sp. IMCC45574]
MKQEENMHKWLNGEKEFLSSEQVSSLEKMSHYLKHIEIPEVNVNNSYNDFKERFDRKPTKVFYLKKIFLAAASLVLLVMSASYFWFLTKETIVETGVAENEVLVLPDNSKVTLNAGSKVFYQKENWDKERVLALSGEAYFKVAKGKRFTVKLKDGFVQVLGTEFNIKDRDKYFEVVCYHGKVKVKHNHTETILTAGKSFSVKDVVKEQYTTTNNKLPSWMLKESSYENVALHVVLDDLERHYLIDLDRSKIDGNKLFRGAFPHDNLEVALNTICLPLNLKFKIENKKVSLFKNE